MQPGFLRSPGKKPWAPSLSSKISWKTSGCVRFDICKTELIIVFPQFQF